MRKIHLVYFDAGGGHRSAAEALKNTLETQDQPWQVELLNLQEQLDKLDIVRKTTGIRLQDAYNLLLRKGWTRLTPQLQLSYDSGTGNSIFGFGWSVDLPVIRRKTDKGLPLYDDPVESDVYIFSGAEDLVPVVDATGVWAAEPHHPLAA